MKSSTLLAIGAFAAIGAYSAHAAEPVNTGYFGNVAIKGYDVVAYFQDGEPILGKEEFTHNWLGADWRFSSAEHLEAFKEDPISYSPQYGGYCAGEVGFGDVTDGVTANIDPEAWKIVDGKLYLFYDKEFAEYFSTNTEELTARAENNWPDVRKRITR